MRAAAAGPFGPVAASSAARRSSSDRRRRPGYGVRRTRRERGNQPRRLSSRRDLVPASVHESRERGRPVPKLHELQPFAIGALTGASAGNINAIISAIEWCGAPADTARFASPEASLFYRLWVNVGIEQLFRPAAVDSGDTGVLNRRFYRRVLYPAIDSGLAHVPPDNRCGKRAGSTRDGLPVGITVSRITPAPFPITSQVAPLTQRYAVVTVFDAVRAADGARTAGFRQASAALRRRTLGALVAPVTDAGTVTIALDTLLSWVTAASAFPIAFGPVNLPYYDAFRLRPDGRCAPSAIAERGCEDPEHANFADGGVFDNNPVGLALGLFRLANTQATVRYVQDRAAQTDAAPRAALRAAAPESLVIALTPRIIYLDPDISRLARTRVVVPAPESTAFAGLDAAVRLLAGAVPTARQYELQTFGRQLADPSEQSVLRLFSAATRAWPIVGDQLSGFGAFLGRPLREYDFYVGVYDGLHYAAEQVLCTDARRQASARRVAAQRAARRADTTADAVSEGSAVDTGAVDLPTCVAAELDRLVGSGNLRLGEMAPYVLHDLIVGEYGRSALPAWPAAAGDVARIGRDETLNTSQAARLVVLRTLVAAERPRLDTASTETCARPDWPGQLLCHGGFAALLARLGTSQVRHLVAGWAAACGDSIDTVRAPERYRFARDVLDRMCLADTQFDALLADPRGAAQVLAWELAGRLRENERRVHAPSTSYSEAVSLALWAARSADPQSRRGLDWSASSIPPIPLGFPRNLIRGLPNHAALSVEPRGGDFGWRPIYHFNSLFALAGPLTISRQPRRDFPRQSELLEPVDWYAGVGVAGVVELPHPLRPWISEVQIGPRFSRVFNQHRPPRIGDALSPDAAAYLLSGKIRIGAFRLPPTVPTAPHRSRRLLTVGIADLPGLAYLLTQH